MIQAPMLVPFSSLCIGIIIGILGVPGWVSIAFIVTAGLVYVLQLSQSSSPEKRRRIMPFSRIWISLAFMGVGLFVQYIHRPFGVPDDFAGRVTATGRVSQICQRTSGLEMQVELRSLMDSAGRAMEIQNVKVMAREAEASFEPADIILIEGFIKPVSADPDKFEDYYPDLLKRKGIHHTIDPYASHIILLKKDPWCLKSVSWRLRNKLEQHIESCPLARQTKNFLITMLLGDREFLDEKIRTQFADGGLSHILALSGMHVGIIAGLIMLLLLPLNYAGGYRVRICISMSLLFLYAFLTGWQPSTTRSVLMYAFAVAALVSERKASGWNALLAATFLILLLDPQSICDAGLQMSFACVAILVLILEPLLHPYKRSRQIVRIMLETFAVTLGVTVSVWTLAAFHFGKLPVMFMVTNPAILPVLPGWLSASVLFLVIFPLTDSLLWAAPWIDRMLEWGLRYVDWATMQGSTSIAFRPAIPSVVLWMVLIVLGALLIHGHRSRRLIVAVYIVAAGCLVSFGTDIWKTSTPDNGIIVKNTGLPVQILVRQGGIENIKELRPGSTAILETPCGTLLATDAAGFAAIGNGLKLPAHDILLLYGKGHDAKVIEDNLCKLQSAEIVLHRSVGRRKAAAIDSVLLAKGIRFHDMTLEGTWKRRHL